VVLVANLVASGQRRSWRYERWPTTPLFAGTPSPSGLTRADRVAKQVIAALGPEWTSHTSLLANVRDELTELAAAIAGSAGVGQSSADVHDELGDVLLSAAILGTFLGVQPESALKSSLDRQEARFQYVRARLDEGGRDWRATPVQQLEQYWAEAKSRLPEPVPPASQQAKMNAFVAAPVSGYSAEECMRYYLQTAELIESMRNAWGFAEIYCAALSRRESVQAERPAEALEVLFRRIAASDVLILLWPRAMVTSALIEVGYALAHGIPVVCLYQNAAVLPFLLSESSPRLRCHSYHDPADLDRLVRTTSFLEIAPAHVASQSQ